jgi:hypothetical protein
VCRRRNPLQAFDLNFRTWQSKNTAALRQETEATADVEPPKAWQKKKNPNVAVAEEEEEEEEEVEEEEEGEAAGADGGGAAAIPADSGEAHSDDIAPPTTRQRRTSLVADPEGVAAGAPADMVERDPVFLAISAGT